MKKQKLNIIISILTIIILLSLNSYSLAINAKDIVMPELSEDYKEYVALPENEKSNRILPELVNIPKTEYKTNNLLRSLELVGDSALDTSFNLMSSDQIGNTINIKNQESTSECWAFSTLSSLETNLNLKNKKNNIPLFFYDFSERHMDYSCVKSLIGGKNIYGFTRVPSQGGTFEMASSYLTNGMGAVNESEMPFENDISDAVNLADIQNKSIAATVYDTRKFPRYEFSDDKTEIIKQMKEHIVKYGSLATKVQSNIFETEFYNNATGAAYYDDTVNFNHGVSIVGWDDNYSVDNFNPAHKPSRNGAWIVRNSWGDVLEYTFDGMKEYIFNSNPNQNLENNWNTPQDIPDASLINWANRMGFIVDEANRKLSYKVGKDGVMYYSYEDSNIYKDIFGIVSASTGKDYDNIYQYNETGAYMYLSLESNSHYVANKFMRNSENEYLTRVGATIYKPCKVKVFVNLNGSSIDKNSLTQVQLESGEYETLSTTGYHSIEFAEPLKINSNEFAVVIYIENQDTSGETLIAIEAEYESYYTDVKIENEKCFITTPESLENGEWIDLSKLSEINSSLRNGDSSIKAFTVNSLPVMSELTEIRVTTPPNKVSYMEGEDFDSNGMVVTAYYSDNTSNVITDYSITNASNLQADQTNVTISYGGKTTSQSITVTPSTTPTPTVTVSPEPTITASPTPTITASPNPTATVSPEPTTTVSPEPTATVPPEPTTTVSPEPTTTVSPKPTTTVSPSPTVTVTPTPNPGGEEDKAVNSNFSNATARATSVKKYNFKNNANQNYSLINIEVSFNQAKGNDSLNYYYYLTTAPYGSGIKLFTKIQNVTSSNGKIQFTINTKEIPNYEDIVNDNTLYLFIQEIAKKGGNQSTLVSSPLELDITTNVEEYEDGVKKNPSGSGKDDTIADKPIPQTGLTPVAIISTFAIIIAGALLFIKYKSIDKDVK